MSCASLLTLVFFAQVLKTQDCLDEIHVNFAKLLDEFNKAGAPYALSVANRLYGEQSYQFVQVCVFQRLCMYLSIHEWVWFIVLLE